MRKDIVPAFAKAVLVLVGAIVHWGRAASIGWVYGPLSVVSWAFRPHEGTKDAACPAGKSWYAGLIRQWWPARIRTDPSRKPPAAAPEAALQHPARPRTAPAACPDSILERMLCVSPVAPGVGIGGRFAGIRRRRVPAARGKAWL